MINLPPLPYNVDALSPHISQETIEYHYGKHHQGYVNKLNKAIKGTQLETLTLEEIIKQAEGSTFNNAAQVWNHTFYWHSLTPQKSEPSEWLNEQLSEAFGSMDEFKKTFKEVALNRFGSGWAWLVVDGNDQLKIISTSNADNPLTKGLKPLCTCDVWEHAYYIDYRNARDEYVDEFFELLNWAFIEKNLKSV
jgi:Fe-Mn family superoxide dismutase